MPPKQKELEDLVLGKDLTKMDYNQLVAFKDEVALELKETEKEALRMRLESRLLRSAWETTEMKIDAIEAECSALRYETDAANAEVEEVDEWGRELKKMDRKTTLEYVREKLFTIPDKDCIAYLTGGCPMEISKDIMAQLPHIDKFKPKTRRRRKKKKEIKKKKKRKGVTEDWAVSWEGEYDMEVDVGVGEEEEGDLELDLLPDEVILSTIDDEEEVGSDALEIVNEEAEREKIHKDLIFTFDNFAVKWREKQLTRSEEEETVANLRLQASMWPWSDYKEDIKSTRKVAEYVEFDQESKFYDYEFDKLGKEMAKVQVQRLTAMRKAWETDVKHSLFKQLKMSRLLTKADSQEVENFKEKYIAENKDQQKAILSQLDTLAQSRNKLINARQEWRINYAKGKSDMEKIMIAEYYDCIIAYIKEKHTNLFSTTQWCFRTTTEKDVNLIHALNEKYKTIVEDMANMKAEIKALGLKIDKLRGPVEDGEKIVKFYETRVNAMQKDQKSLRANNRLNRKLEAEIDRLRNDVVVGKAKTEAVAAQIKKTEEAQQKVNEFRFKLKEEGNPFSKSMKEVYREETKKLQTIEQQILDSKLVTSKGLPALRCLVLERVAKAKQQRWNRKLEAKAFNELINQFELRASSLLLKSFPRVDRVGIPYRKSTANLITTFNQNQKITPNPFHKYNT